MDFSFITSILRSRSFPPIDPWASGIYLNYYYYGHYLVAMLTKLSGVPPQIGYNLAFSLIPALVLSGIFSIVRGVTGRARYGLFGAAVAGLAGNLDGLFLLIDMQPWRDAVYRSLHLVLPTHREHVFRFFRCAHEVIQNTVHEFPFWSFTFVDLHAHVIAMPFAVFLLAFCLNIIMRSRSGFGAFGTGAAGVENYCIAAVVLGMTVPMNTWDFPIYLAAITLMLLAADVIIRGERPHRIPLSSQSFWWDSGFRGRMLCAVMSIARLEGPIGGALGVALRVGAPAMLLGAAAIGAYAPLFIFFGREGMGLGLVGDLTTPAEALLRFFGFFLFIIASYLALELVRYADGSAGLWKRLAVIALCAAVAALPWAAFDMTGTRDYASLSLALLFLLAGCLVLRRRGADRRVAYALLLIVYGMAIIALCELFHIRDFYQGGSHKRFNTIFKFYIAVWYFFAIGGSFCLSRFMAGPVRRREGWRRAVILSVRALWAVVFIALCAAALVFTVMGPRARTIGDDNYPRTSLEPRWDGGRSGSGLLATMFPRALSRPTLDGFSYMKARLPDEYDAISWLNDTVAGQPVIAEDTGADYLYEYARVASNTGLPTILGWWSHVDQRGYKYGEGRKNDVFKLYRSLDPLELATLIAKYDIQLIFVGNTERRHYRPDAIEKFNALTGLFRHVFHSKTVDIYQTASSPAFAQETEMRKEGGGAQAAAPIVIPRARMLEGGQGDGPGQYNEPRGIAIDGKGNVYVADFRNYRIQKFDSKGLFVNAWGEEGEFPGQFKDPCGVAVDASGRVYVADTFNNRVQVFSGDGKFLSSFEGGFFAPRGIAVDGRGRIWVTDTGNGAVKLFSPEGELINTVGKRGKGEGEFDGPTGIAVDSKGMAYVADAGNRRIQVLDRNGKLTRVFKVDGWEPMVFDEPYLALDGRGDIYLTDPPGNRVLKYSPQGKLLGVLKPMEGAEPLLSFPMGVAVEKDGQAIYIVDCRHHRIQKFSKRDLIHVK
jgi:YYY domain-containing protein